MGETPMLPEDVVESVMHPKYTELCPPAGSNLNSPIASRSIIPPVKPELPDDFSPPDSSGMDRLQAFLKTLDRRADQYLISNPRRFAHAEVEYDAGYANQPGNRDVGEGLLNICRAYGGDFGSPAIEVGCGTGLVSLGLVLERAYPYVLLTDPSPAFLDIARKKLTAASAITDQVGFGVLLAEDLERLPENLFSLLVLRSALHHVLDVPAFINMASRILKPGGLLVMEEPCYEGAVVMASMATLLPAAVTNAGENWTDECQRQLQLFLDTMYFYCSPAFDKSQAEDKHIFRVDQLNALGISAGFEVNFAANQTFYHWTAAALQNPSRELFSQFMRMYLKHAMHFDETFMRYFDAYLQPHCQWVDRLCEAGNGPYCHGIFIWKKQDRARG
jgi:ubiquinone/menaquinone biosynthesis C-methylase UbiE